MLAAVLIFLAFLAERPYVFFRYPALIELSRWPKVAALMAFIFAWWLLFLLLYIYAAKSSPRVKWTIFGLLAISSTLFDVYYLVSGGATLLYADYAVLVDAIGSSGDALSEYYPFFAYSAIRLAVLFCAFLVMKQSRGASVKAISLLSVSVLAFAGICVLKHGTYTNLLPGSTGIYGLSIASLFDSSSQEYAYSGAPQPQRAVQDMNIVLVVDESVRADFLTGSDLRKIFAESTGGWRYHDFGAATSAGNCSAASNIMLRKGVRPGSITSDLYENPLIWSYAQNAGFATYLLDAQRNGKGHDHFDSFELKMVSSIIEASHLQWDHEIPGLMDHLELPGKSFTFVITKGSHFPYYRNFPSDHTADAISSYVSADDDRIAYAKSIDWQTKKFIKQLISRQIDKPTLVIYTSDHGQNLNDQPGGRHCTVSGTPFIGEGLVPLMVLTNFEDGKLQAAQDFNHGKLSHFHIFPTILQYMGFDTQQPAGEGGAYTAAIVDEVHPLNRFTYGDAFGRFGQAVKFLDVAEQKDALLRHRGVTDMTARLDAPVGGREGTSSLP